MRPRTWNNRCAANKETYMYKRNDTTRKKRLTVMIDADIYADIKELATEQRRELNEQVIILLERSVKLQIGQQRAKKRRDAVRAWSDGIDQE